MCWRLKWNTVTAASIIYFVSYLFYFINCLLDWLIILDSCAHGFLRNAGSRRLPCTQSVERRHAALSRLAIRGVVCVSVTVCWAPAELCQSGWTDRNAVFQQSNRSTVGVSGCTVIKSGIWYDTIRDAILTCARKPTWVSLIYPTETTTKKCKTEKVKSKNGYAQK